MSPRLVAGRLRYVLITPARNEAAFIEETIRSVIAQTVRPLKWVIVSDGSTDGTDEIVRKHAVEHDWIELVRMPERNERHFAGKVYAFNAGYARVQGLDYKFIASLDADVSFDVEYCEFVLSKLVENPLLGVAGTPFREGDTTYDYRYTSLDHVSGACQFFKRECFESIGGYVPLQVGGIDLVAGTHRQNERVEHQNLHRKSLQSSSKDGHRKSRAPHERVQRWLS